MCFLIFLQFRFGCLGFSVSFKVYFGLCYVVLIWGWLGVCLVSIQSCCSVSLVLAFFFGLFLGLWGSLQACFSFLLCSAWVYFVLV